MSERSIFLAAMEKADSTERAAYLEQACTGQPQLRRRVEVLLEAVAHAGSFLEHPPGDPNATGAFAPESLEENLRIVPPQENIGDHVGPYKLLQKLGEGGMGTVWVAEQQQPVKRRVALKVIKAGMDSAQVLRRFEAERQALALMDHTNIARVLDAGTTAAGRPYFAMELVPGVPIQRYCDELHLTVRERLELFLPVCRAIQHAHQKGIIHRDIKPSNVLVSMQDGKPVAKVIDFGVAKALSQQLTERTMYTEIGAVIGTLEYMAPEQAEMSPLGVDTRSDIYSLGVLLYELLTGTTPLDTKRLRSAAYAEMLRIIREEEPLKPSTRLTQSKESLASLAAQRRTEPTRLAKEVRGELDWIVMKCLEKDRTRRYETANGLARDLERHLQDEPVEACPPSARYRLGKFVRRYKGPVAAAGLVLIALLIGVVTTAHQASRARVAEKEAWENARQEQKRRHEAEQAEAAMQVQWRRAEAAETAAKKRLTQIEKGNEILSSIFVDLDPREEEKLGKPLRAILGDRLARAAVQLEGEAVGDPLLVARMQNRLAASLVSLGMADQAIPLFLKARATHVASLGPDHPQTLNTMHNLAWAYRDAGQLNLALPLLEETFKLRKAALSPDHPDTIASMCNLAGAYQDAGKLNLALPLFKEALQRTTATLDTNHHHPYTLMIMNNLARAYVDAGQRDLALPLYLEALKYQKVSLGLDHPDTLNTMNNLARAYQAAGEWDLALALLKETLELRKAKLGPDHPGTLNSMNNLGLAYWEIDKLDLALPLLEETLRFRKVKLGFDHPDTLTSMNNLATAYRAAGKLNLAVPLFEETLKLRRAKLGPDDHLTLTSMNNLAVAYWAAKQWDKSIPLLEDALRRREATLGRDHLDTLHTVVNLGITYKDAGRLAEALPLLEEGYRAAKKDPKLQVVGPHLLEGYVQAGKSQQVIALAKEVLTDARLRLPPESPQLAGQLASIGFSLLQVKAYAEAETLLRECLALREKKEPDAWTTFNTRSLLGGVLLGQKKYAEAESLLLQGYEGMKQRADRIPPQGKVRLTEALERLIQLDEAMGKKEEEAKWRKELETVKKS